MDAINANSRSRGASSWAVVVILTTLLAMATPVSSFGIIQPSIRISRRPTTTHLSAKTKPFDPTYKAKPPKLNKQTSLWEPSPETEPEPYGLWGSFLRGGPSPFITRLFSPLDYDQAVFKYMAQTSCSRAEAQGNMDAYFNNAADWAFQKKEEANGRPKVDYTLLKPKQAALVVGWALFVTPFLGRCAYLIAFGANGWGLTLDDVFTF